MTAFLQDQVVGRRLSEITLPALQTMATRADAGTAMTLFPLLRIVFELAREIGDGELYLGGQQNLLSYRELGSSAHELLKLLTDREELLGILSAFGRGVHVALGDELSDPLGDTSLIVSRYPIGRRGTGMVAVLGPIRVNYASIIANLEYFPTGWPGCWPKRRRRTEPPDFDVDRRPEGDALKGDTICD